MGKKRTFKFDGEVYDVPEQDVEGFLSRKPKAVEVESFVVGKDTFDVPLTEVKGFLERKPQAQPINQEPDTTTKPVPIIFGRPPMDETSDDNNPDLPSVTLDKEGEISPVVQMDIKSRNAIVDAYAKAPEGQRDNPVFEKTFVNEYSKRTGQDPRAVKKIYQQGVKDYNEYVALKAQYDTHPDDINALYRIGELLNGMGKHEEAYQAYKTLEKKLYDQGVQEYQDPNNPNKRPDYVIQKQLPATQGLAYTEALRGNKQEADRLYKLVQDSGGLSNLPVPQVGEGDFTNQPTSDQPSSYGFTGKRGDDTTPTLASQYLKDIGDAVGQVSLVKPMVEMPLHGMQKVGESVTSGENLLSPMTTEAFKQQIKFVTGLTETAAGFAGLTTPAGAVYGMPFMQAQNMLPKEASEWMMPANKAIHLYYEKQGKTTPEWAENVGTILSFASLAALHGVANKTAKVVDAEVKGRKIASAIDKGVQEYENQNTYVKRVLEDLSDSEVHEMMSDLEKRYKAAGQDSQIYVESLKENAIATAEKAKEVESDIQTIEDFNEPVEPYKPEPVKGSLAEVKEGSPATYQGKEGVIDRGDDGTWYFTTDDGKSVQIKVEDKFNPTESLTDLGIDILPEVSPDQVARAVADAEQTGWVEMNGKKYFVSLDRVGKENPNGDFVYEQRTDGSLVNRFDSHRDPVFAENRKLKIVNKFLEEKGLPKRESLIEPWKQSEPTSKGAVTPEEVQSAPEPALIDIESTTKALAEADNKNWNKVSKLSPLKTGAFKERSDLHEAIAEAYHKAKADDSNPKLVKAVEELLKPEENANKIEVIPEDIRLQVEKEVDAMPDEAVEQMLADLDENAPTTTEELNKLYEERTNNGTEENAPESKTERTQDQADGEDLGKIREEVIREEANAKATQEIKDAQKEYEEAKADYDAKRKEVDERIGEQQQQKMFAEGKPENPLEVDIDVSQREKALAESKQRFEKAKAEMDRLQGLKVTGETLKGRAKMHKAIDDLESALLNLPGIKDLSGGAEKAGVGASDVIKFVMNRIREGLDAGYTVAEAVKRAIDSIKESDAYKGFFDAVNEEQFREAVGNAAKEKFKEQGIDYNKPTEQLFAAKHASTDQVREVLGIPKDIEVTTQHKRDVATVMENGKKLVDGGLNVQSLAESVIADRRAINADEQAALVYAETQLYNDIVKTQDDIVTAIDKGDTEKVKQLQTQLTSLLAQDAKILDALEMAGSEQGLAFRMRQVMSKRDYSVVAMERKYKAATGGKEMPSEVRDLIDQQTKIISDSQKRIADLEKALEQQKAEQALADIQESIGREKPKPKPQTSSLSPEKALRKKELAAKFRGMFNDISNIPRLLADKEFLEYGKLVLEEAAGDFKKFVKKLTEDFGDKVIPHAQEIFDAVSKKEYNKAYQDDAGIHIDNSLIRDIVKEGVENAQELVDKVYDVVRKDLPDVTRREVQDAISGYGKTINPPENPLRDKINSLKRDLKLEGGLEDAKAGKGVKKSGYQRPKPTDYQRDLQRQINEELKNHPQDQAELQKKWATALDRTKTGLRNSIADLTKRIDDIENGRPVNTNPKKALLLDQEAKDLKAMRDGLRERLQELEGKPELSEEQKIQNAIGAAERMRDEYDRRAEEIRRTGTYTGKPKTELSSPELDIARGERDQAKAQYEAALAGTDIPQKVATSRALSAAEKKVTELETKVRRNDIGYAARAMSLVDVNNPELKAAKQRVKELNEVINQMREEQGLVEARKREMWKNRVRKRIADLERRVQEKDFSKKEVKETELDAEMQRLKMAQDRAKFNLDVAIEKARWESQSPYKKFSEHVFNVIGASKSLLATGDLSAVLRQGVILTARHPALAFKAFVEMLRQAKSQSVADAWHDALISSDAYILAKNADLFLSEPMAKILAQEEIFSHNLAERIPLLGRVFKGSNRAYTAYLNKLRMDVFMQHYDSMVREGFKGKELAKEAKAMAYLINNFTGRGSLGKAEIAAPIANMLYFAPRFVASRFNTLANALTGYYYETAMAKLQGRESVMTTRARIEAYKAIGSYIGTGMSVLALAKLAGADVDTDPRSSDFGKIKIGNTRFDIWAGFQQLVVLFTRISTQAYKDSRTGEIKEMGEGRNKNALDFALTFNRSKMSPQAGVVYDKLKGRFPDNTEFAWSKAAINQMIPLMYKDMYDIYKQEGAAKALGVTLPMTLGVGVQSYETPEIITNSKLNEREVKLFEAKKFVPENSNDKTVYVKGQEYEISPEDLEKIKKRRAEIAGEMVKENYEEIKSLNDKEFATKVNSYYNQALKDARSEVLPEGWHESKKKGSASGGRPSRPSRGQRGN